MATTRPESPSAQVVKNGRATVAMVEGLDPFQFEGKSYEYDLEMVRAWHKEQTGNDNGPVLDKLHHDLAAIYHQTEPTNEKDVLNPETAATALLETYEFRTFSDTGEILVYREGVYEFGGEVVAKSWLEEHAESCTERLVNETIGHLQRRTYIDRDDFDSDSCVLNLRNGLLDLKTWEVKAHSPEYLSMVQLPVTYNPAASCPLMMKFLSEVLDQEDVQLVQEFVGYCLWRDYPGAKALLFVGDGENGKSTLIHLLKSLLGRENYSSRGLQELEFNRFAKADLYGKLANLYADLPDSALKATGTFKMLTGGDPITAEHKFRSSFTFTNYAKLIFSANKVPEVYEDTTGFFRRWFIVTFPNQFSGAKADKDLKVKLTTDEELSGFLNWALEGLKRLQSKGWNFSDSKSTEEVREEYIRKSSPIRAFLMDCTEVRSDAFTSKKEAFTAFTTYCRKRKLPAVTDQTFFKNLPQFTAISESRPFIEGKRVHGYTGLSIKPENEWVTTKVGGTLDSLDSLDASDGSVHPVQPVQGLSNFSSHTCEVCHKTGARGLVREGGVVYLHPDCEKEWGGKL